ncbi:MAG: type I-C CRISPR-associated protein Cas8c/Csd1 [Chthonomonadales bacterium]|nr:type I-C CRISPR-associated protein Cas8c/Csd1 [Chthonomonadales bacterium]
MILQQLYKDAPAILGEELPPPMYDRRPVRWVVELDDAGGFLGFTSLGGDAAKRKGIDRLVPYVGRTSGVRAILLADTPAYVFGKPAAPPRVDRNVAAKRAAFRDLVARCVDDTGEAAVRAVLAFLDAWSPETHPLPEDMGDSDLVVFHVGDTWPADLPAVRDFWAGAARPEPAAGQAMVSQCLVTGRFGPVVQSMPGMVKGVPGGKSSGVALVSANCEAFESYGLERAETSPISAEAAERFTKALNRLIAGRRTHITLGQSLVYVFWTSQGADDETADLLDMPDEARVRDMLDSLRTGRRLTVRDDDPFHAFALSGSAGRAVVRDWLSTTVGEARRSLAAWFDAQRVVSPEGREERFFGVYPLAASLYRDARKEMRPTVPRDLLLAALHREPLPMALLERAVQRNRAEGRVTYPRAALIKAVLSLHRTEEPRPMAELDEASAAPAYLCGRLLAELEAVQRTALGKTNVTIVGRYYGAASSAPAVAFGVLLAHANKAHLPKIRKKSEPAYNALQNRLAEIAAPLKAFPTSLNLREQGLFSLGYYHQRAADRLAAKEAVERRARGAATAEDAAVAEALADTDNTEDTDA